MCIIHCIYNVDGSGSVESSVFKEVTVSTMLLLGLWGVESIVFCFKDFDLGVSGVQNPLCFTLCFEPGGLEPIVFTRILNLGCRVQNPLCFTMCLNLGVLTQMCFTRMLNLGGLGCSSHCILQCV